MPAPLKLNTIADADLLIEPESQDDSQTSSGNGAANETTAPKSAADSSADSGDAAAALDLLNDAEILGLPDLMGDILDRPATLLLGEMWGAKDRRNTLDGDWSPVTMSWRDWIIGGAKTENTAAWGFSRPRDDVRRACATLSWSLVSFAASAAALPAPAVIFVCSRT